MARFAGISILSICCLFCFAQSKTPSVDDVLKSVYTQAAKENKYVLLIFHASWCGWCHKMDTSLQDKNVKPIIDRNYITTHLTVYESKEKKNMENPGALEFLTKHGGADKGIPYWLVLDKSGNVLANSEYAPGKTADVRQTKKRLPISLVF
jgi:thioredoxin-related protein